MTEIVTIAEAAKLPVGSCVRLLGGTLPLRVVRQLPTRTQVHWYRDAADDGYSLITLGGGFFGPDDTHVEVLWVPDQVTEPRDL